MVWFLRKWFWIFIAWFKAAMNKPLDIPLPGPQGPRITPVPLSDAVPGLPIHRVLVCPPAQIPADERSASKTGFYRLQVALYKAFSPMQPGLPNTNADPDHALRHAYTWLHRRHFGPPVLPAEFLRSPDLGALAVRGPYACYTRKAANGLFEWDLRSLSTLEHHEGLLTLGARVVFEVDRTQRVLQAVRIDTALGSSVPGDAGWPLAKKLALCSATTHLSLVRHFNWVHLAGGAMLAIATRNQLPGSHKLMRLLFPYIYGTQQSNDMVTRGQMLPGGDFESVFSFSFEGQCRLFDDTWGDFDIVHNDPPADAARRGVLGQGFDTPTEDNLAALFELMHDHARRYIALCWAVELIEPMQTLDTGAMRQLQFMLFEALSNVLQHANARTLRIEAHVQDDNRVFVRVVDDGCGFDLRSKGKRGMASLRERAAAIGAQLRIASQSGQTVVEIQLQA